MSDALIRYWSIVSLPLGRLIMKQPGRDRTGTKIDAALVLLSVHRASTLSADQNLVTRAVQRRANGERDRVSAIAIIAKGEALRLTVIQVPRR
jgi:hypothetical protein